MDSVGGFYSPAAVCFLVQLAAMVFVATCIMHVQVPNASNFSYRCFLTLFSTVSDKFLL